MDTLRMYAGLLVILAVLDSTSARLSTGKDCILMCVDADGVAIADGDYQYCWSCHKYVVCDKGSEKYEDCADGEAWNDVSKACEAGPSPTCAIRNVTSTGHACIKSCADRPTGSYQACDDCHYYIKCKEQKQAAAYCEHGMLWDDIDKICKKKSKTCMRPLVKEGDDCEEKVHKGKKMNVLFILADDLGWNDIGYHNPEFKTPYLDSLAKTGRRLNHLYYQPGCTPSRFALMTGYYPFKGGMQHFILAGANPTCVPLDLQFLPQKLKKQGYNTHIMGKWHIGYCQKACTPTERGFDTFMGMYGGQGDQFTHESQPPDPILYDWRNNMDLDFSANGTHITDLLNDHAINLLHSMDENEPFFMILTHTVPHHPLQAPQKYVDMFQEEPNHERKMVKAMMAHLDARTKDLVHVLKERGFYDNTLIIFTSDNGGDIGAHHDNSPLRGGKGSLYEGGTRVVGFVHGPMLHNTGTIHEGLIHVTDLHATILSLAGIKDHDDLDGVDQSEMLLNGYGTKRSDMIYNIDLLEPAFFGHSAYRDQQYKLIWGYVGYADGYGLDAVPTQDYQESLDFLKVLDPIKFGEFDNSSDGSTDRLMALLEATKIDVADKSVGSVRLYDLIDDPSEKHDLSEDPFYKGRIKSMKQKVLKHYLAGFSPPSVESTQFWIPQVFGSLERNAWAHGWCDDLQLDRTHKHMNYVDID